MTDVRRRKSGKTPATGKSKPNLTSSSKDVDITKETWLSWTQHVFGFTWKDFSSWGRLVELMNRPCDPSMLAWYRILFGFLMSLDIPQERGLSYLDYRWGDQDECRFPLFNFLEPLSLQWMYIVYLFMLGGALGIMLGFLFKLSCMVFIITYWYVFFLDKTHWNNHSYLYGLNGFLLLFSGANRYASVDAKIWTGMKNTQIPLWNYALFRFQFFLVYFIAGLKKLDADWVTGYSMSQLSTHWVFMPFTYVLTKEQIDLIIVHWGGLTIDLFIGFFLFFDALRPIALVIGNMFHCMNSQIFSIGMFPYAMMGSHFVFSAKDWPKKVIRRLPQCLQKVFPTSESAQPSLYCLYVPKTSNQHSKSDKKKNDDATGNAVDAVAKTTMSVNGWKARWWHHLGCILTINWMLVQAFLPYSHFLTQGYNNWTNGLYGYSWDMMVHSWSTLHVRITYVNKDTGDVGYLNPEAWTRSQRGWTSHADMVKQYASCIEAKLVGYGINNTEIYFDVWRSLNDRFQQRLFDPRVDVLHAEWSPFKATSWILPLLVDLEDWRLKLDKIEQGIYNVSNNTDVVFIADFPGLVLENYIQEELSDTKLQVLKGEVIVEFLSEERNYTVHEGDKIKIPSGDYHNVYTVSTGPSCYMYTFVNHTEAQLADALIEYEKRQQAAEVEAEAARKLAAEIGTDMDGGGQAPEHDGSGSQPHVRMDELSEDMQQTLGSYLERKHWLEHQANRSITQRFYDFLADKAHSFKRGAFMSSVAVKSILLGQDFQEIFNESTKAMPDVESM